MEAMLATWGPVVVMIAIFYFLLYRPQKNQQKRRREMLESLKKGNRVMTIGGIYGTITNVQETTVKLKIADNVVIEVARASINANITAAEQTEKAEEKPEEKAEAKADAADKPAE